jgi:hypothetical protein
MYMAPTKPIDITKENLKLLEKQLIFGIGNLSDLGPGPLPGPNWPPLSPKYLGERSQVEYLGSGFYVPPRITNPPVHQQPSQPYPPYVP